MGNSKLSGRSRWLGLDPFGILFPPGALCLAWLLIVIALTNAQQPGVICMTPFIWLMALIVGGGVVKYSRSQQAAALRKEAAIAGGLFGFLTGGVYLAQTLIVFGEDQASQRFSVLSGLGLMVGGVVLCALLSLGMAALTLRRPTSESYNKSPPRCTGVKNGHRALCFGVFVVKATGRKSGVQEKLGFVGLKKSALVFFQVC